MTIPATNDRLAAITAAGTSIWLDQLRRGMIEGGELRRMVQEDSLRGVTSNPAIFERAMLGSADYDAALSEAALEGLTAREIYRRLAIEDVQAAADVLAIVYTSTGGADGFVSLEVDPDLADDTDATLDQALTYWEAVDRPNLMIKIPATAAGIPAIEEALFRGLHVNVTLLFSVAAYEDVIEAYIRAMERRLEAGLALDRQSVASFFVSRVDSEVDKRLHDLEREDLLGRAALANARLAYRAFRAAFDGDRFAALRDAGCPVQRPLWASTGVKNPRYPETLYVYGLLGPDTVSTLPLPTLRAAATQGEAVGPTASLDPTADLEALAAAGIDLDDVTAQLLREGIDAFLVPMEKLLAGLDVRREAIVTGRPATIEASLPAEFEGPLAQLLQRAHAEDVVRRIWSRDGTLWAPAGTPEVADRLGWLTVADKMHAGVAELDQLAADAAKDGLTDVLLLGMGGSSLAPEVFRRSYGSDSVHVLDTTEPITIGHFQATLEPEHTLVIVSTKSGGTIETLSLFERFWQWSPDGSRFVAITDPDSALAELAAERGFRRTFLNDPEIGGRYSALSNFGLVPAALAGVDVEGQLHASEVAEQNCMLPTGNSGLWLGCALGHLALAGRDKVTFVVDAPLESYGLWVEQLIAESTGKHGRGALPVADEPLADPSRYGADRVFVHIANDDAPDESHVATIAALAAAGHPTITVRAHGPGDLGRVFFFSEFGTAVAGWVLGINPFDQPNVQSAKDATSRVLADGAPELEDGTLETLLEGLAPPNYLAIQGYLPYDDATDAAVRRLRAALLERFGVATTWGYGPRFLHSTGQFHKGGPPVGRFLQLLHDSVDDLEIPGRDFGFRTLIAAQADGDLQTLRDSGQPAVRVRSRRSADRARHRRAHGARSEHVVRDDAELQRRGDDHERVEDLVVAEHRGDGVGTAGRVDDRAERVEHAADGDEQRRSDTEPVEHLRRGGDGDPAERDVRHRDQPLRRVDPDELEHHADERPSPHRDADGGRQVAFEHEHRERRVRAGDEDEDHRVIEPSDAPAHLR